MSENKKNNSRSVDASADGNKARRTLIVNYAGMNQGGIEVYLSNLMLYSVKQGYRVIWITTPYLAQAETTIKAVKECSLIERCYVKLEWHWPSYSVRLDPDEHVTMISCEPISFMKAEALRRSFKGDSFDHFLLLPHFTGAAYYPERFFKGGLLNKLFYRYMKRFAKAASEKNCIRGFDIKHLNSYEKNYSVSISEKEDKILRGIKAPVVLDDAYFRRKARERGDRFTICSCSRLDFPHKGYMMGLIDCFERINLKYPFTKLVIIGDGPNRAELEDRIGRLPDSVREAIDPKLFLEFNEVNEEFRKSHLNVGLAGAIYDGAAVGVPSLLVRHYSMTCETYGFLADNRENTLRADDGEDIFPYIEEMIVCDDERYISQCRADSEFSNSLRSATYDPEYLFCQHNLDSGCIVNRRQTVTAKILNLVFYVKCRYFSFHAYD